MPSTTITVYDRKNNRTLSYHRRQAKYGYGEEIGYYSAEGVVLYYELARHATSRRGTLFRTDNPVRMTQRFELLRRQLRNSRQFQVL